ICLLSDATALQGALARLDTELATAANEQLRANHGINQPPAKTKLIKHLHNNKVVCDGAKFRSSGALGVLPFAKLSVSKLLRRCFGLLNVGGLALNVPSAVFSDAASQSF